MDRLEDRNLLSSASLAVTSLADSGPGTLRAAITQADSGSAEKTYNIRFNVRGAITLVSALPDLTRNMNLIGSGASRLTIQRDLRAVFGFHIFTVETGVNVTIDGMTIARAFAIGNGGAVDNHGAVTLDHTKLVDNFADQGGGVENDGKMTIKNSTIADNLAQNGDGIGNTGTLKLCHTVLAGNQRGADSFGGGIFNTGTLTGCDLTFSANVATGGGGIYNSGSVTLKHATFASNSATNGRPAGSQSPNNPAGGAIVNAFTGTFSLNHVALSGNSAENGGGICNFGKMTISDGTISHCIAGSAGGGIYNAAFLTVNRTTFKSNVAEVRTRFVRPIAGGIYNTTTGSITMSRTTFDRNQAIVGGGLYNSGVISESRNSFSRNTAVDGGGIYNDGTFTETHDNLARNGAGLAGSVAGAIHNTGSLTVSHTNVSRNVAAIAGGLYNDGGGHAEVEVSTLNDPAGGGLVNSTSGIGNPGSTVHIKKTLVDHIFYADKLFS